MVLCKHFQQGNCRFGTKCHFEHVDIKQLVKTDIESAINGKQYLFSCYGPFKDKPCVPNFIQDQSFEEMRLMCYEAKQKNFFEQFHQATMETSMDAMNKMKALMQPTYENLNVLTMIYDTPVGNSSQAAASTNNNSSNPFGLNSGNSNNAAPGSIFGKSNLSQVNNNNSFGGSSIFGGGATPNNVQSGGGIFGGQNTFGAQQQPTQQPSIFGQATQPQSAPSIFGSGMTKPSIFGQQSAPAQNSGGSGFGLFAQAAAQAQTAPAYGSTANFGQVQQMPAQQPQQQGIFNQNIFSNQTANANPFGQQQQQQQQPQQNLFGQVNTMMPTQQTQQPQQPGQNIFAQALAQQPTQSGGLFQQSVPATMATGNMQQPQFGQVQQPFTQTSTPQMQSHIPGLPQNSSSIYSRIEDLGAEQIAAFKAEIFEPGKLPFVPPPIELVNGSA